MFRYVFPIIITKNVFNSYFSDVLLNFTSCIFLFRNNSKVSYSFSFCDTSYVRLISSIYIFSFQHYRSVFQITISILEMLEYHYINFFLFFCSIFHLWLKLFTYIYYSKIQKYITKYYKNRNVKIFNLCLIYENNIKSIIIYWYYILILN